MNAATVKELRRRRDEAQKMVDAITMLLKDVPGEQEEKKTNGTRPMSRGENGFTTKMLDVIGTEHKWVSEISDGLKEKYPETDGPEYRSVLPVRVQTECSRQYRKGVLKRKKIEGKWAYYVK